jgi:hypothetical protein
MAKMQYDQAVFEDILESISNGMLMAQIHVMPGMPSRTEFQAWIDADPILEERFYKAKMMQADVLAEQIIVIADNPNNTDPGFNFWSKLRIDARKWTAGKLRPQRWGDRVINEHSGPNGGALITEVRYIVHDPRVSQAAIEHVPLESNGDER